MEGGRESRNREGEKRQAGEEGREKGKGGGRRQEGVEDAGEGEGPKTVMLLDGVMPPYLPHPQGRRYMPLGVRGAG